MEEFGCNCENSKCIHSQNEKPCKNTPQNNLTILYIGIVCPECFDKFPVEYRKET